MSGVDASGAARCPGKLHVPASTGQKGHWRCEKDAGHALDCRFVFVPDAAEPGTLERLYTSLQEVRDTLLAERDELRADGEAMQDMLAGERREKGALASDLYEARKALIREGLRAGGLEAENAQLVRHLADALLEVERLKSDNAELRTRPRSTLLRRLGVGVGL